MKYKQRSLEILYPEIATIHRKEVLDDLLDRAQSHFPLASMTERLAPFEFMLLSMVIEQRKEIKQLKDKSEGISSKLQDIILQQRLL